jgi:hypothetical protein
MSDCDREVIGYKDGPILVFMRDDKQITYDLRDNKFYRRLKTGQLKELADTGVARFFRNVTITEVADGFDDKVYSRLMRMINRMNYNKRIRTFGTLFAQLYKYAHYESYILLDVKFAYDAFSNPISQFPKAVRQFMQESNETFSHKWESCFKEHPKLVQDVCTYVRDNYYMDLEVYRMVIAIFSSGYYGAFNKFSNLVIPTTEKLSYSSGYGFGCEYKALFDYMVKIVRTEAMSMDNCLQEYYDYLRMSRDMELAKVKNAMLAANPDAYVDNIVFNGYGRIEKYPQYLAIRHNVVSKNYSAFMNYYDEEVFALRVDHSLEYNWGCYRMVTPKTTQDVKDEGSALHHCVGSYINRILDGTTQIVFMRQEEDESLVTVEIRNNTIIQARGYNNRDIDESEIKWMKIYAKSKNLSYKDIKHDPKRDVELAQAA